MGPSEATLFLGDEYPWKTSALITALTELVISIIFLLNSVVICLAFRLRKWCGLICENPSLCDPYPNERRTLRKDASGYYRKRSRSHNERSLSSVGQNCGHMNPYLPLNKYERSFSYSNSWSRFEYGERSAGFEEADSCSTRHSVVVEAGGHSDSSSSISKPKHGNVSRLTRKGSFMGRKDPILEKKGSFAKMNDSILDRNGSILNRNGSFSERRGSFPERRGSFLERRGSFLERKGSLLGRKGSLLEKEDSFLKRKGLISERNSSFFGRSSSLEDSLDRAEKYITSKTRTAGNDGIEDLKSSPREVVDENSSKSPLKQNTQNLIEKFYAGWEESRMSSEIMSSLAALQEIEDSTGCFNDENLSSSKKENGNGDDLIRKLREALCIERERLSDLYNELESERIASETAANETLAKILHLQEEKAALKMQAEHYQRMAEEKASYDEQAMLILKDILYRKERENYLLEMEVNMIRKRLHGEGKRRMESETPVISSLKNDGILLLKDASELQGSEGVQDTKMSIQSFCNENDDCSIASSSMIERKCREHENSITSLPFISRLMEEHPYKRLKRVESVKSVQEDGLIVNVQHQPRFSLVGNHGKELNYISGSGSHDHGLVSKHYKQADEEAESISTAINEGDTKFNSIAIKDAHVNGRGKQEVLNLEGANHLYGSVQSDTVVLADKDKSSIDLMNHATKKEFWMEFHQYKAGNENLCAQSSYESETSGLAL